MMLLFRLYLEFFKIGLLAVGGGMATIPFLTDLSAKTGWFTYQELTDMVAVAESTPGAIGVNTATYVGFTTAGPLGGIIATLGLVTPSIILILLIVFLLRTFSENRFVKTVFRCLRPASLALIVSAALSVAIVALVPKQDELLSVPNALAWGMAIVLFLLMQVIPKTKKLHPIVWIAISAACGILLL